MLPDGRFDMLTPIRRHGAFLTATTDDAVRTREGLVRWADRVVPQDVNHGAADAPWLADMPVMKAAITAAVAGPETRDTGYGLANRVFSSLYTAMRAREAVEILEEVLVSGDGPATIGAQVARRAGIAASEVRGTYEGLWLLERSDEHARGAPDPDLERSRNASIRAEMHLDAARSTWRRPRPSAPSTSTRTGLVVAQATRTITDVLVSRGDFAAAQQSAQRILSDTTASPRALDRAVDAHPARPDRARAGSVRRGRLRGPRGAARRGPGRRGRGSRCWPRPCCASSSPAPRPPTSTARACRGRSGCRCSARTPATTSATATSPARPVSRRTWSCSPTAAGWAATRWTGG